MENAKIISRKSIEKKVKKEYKSARSWCRGGWGRYYWMMIDTSDASIWSDVYTAALDQIPERQEEQPPDFKAVRKILDDNYRTIYETLTREDKRTLWRTLIKEIRIDNDKNITGIIFG